jgi:hypothetical protein
MRRVAFVMFLAFSAPVTSGVADADGARTAVVVELFSSEGCSSCPVADALLARLDRDQPIAGAEVIALEMHVDYWNRLGWTDPFSQSAFSARQREHVSAMGTRSVYTPQMIVDGRDELIGSSALLATQAIERAARAPHVSVKLARSGDSIAIDVGPPPVSEGVTRVMLAVTERGLRSTPTSGENRGEALAHGPVVRSLRALGDVSARGSSMTVTEPARAGRRVVVFVEGRDSLRILGAATL